MSRVLVRHFFSGLLLLAPATFTVYLIATLVRALDRTFDVGYPGLGVLIIAVLITLVGWVASALGLRPLLTLLERLVHRIPLVGIVYSSVRDLFAAFVGDNQKFNRPVIVKLTEDSESCKVGFVTQEELSALDLPDMAAVYFPDSYNFSGDLMLVPRRHIRPLNVPSAQVMKFVVSGGVAHFTGHQPVRPS